jgi:three-Cys-motif partner protein
MVVSGMIFRLYVRPSRSPLNDEETEGPHCWPLGERETRCSRAISRLLYNRSQKSATLVARHDLCRCLRRARAVASRTQEKVEEPPGLFGPDQESDDAEVQFLKGSPRVALDIPNPFSGYVFIDRDPTHVTELKALKAEYGAKRDITIHESDSNTALEAWVSGGTDWKHHRAVVFLDPFGMQVSWSTIEMLARTKAIEVMINFPLGMAIQRLLTRSGEIPPGWQISLDAFFGSPDWRRLIYEESDDLFGPRLRKISDSGIRLLEWYRERLRTMFGHVSTARLIKNTRGNPLYYLIWAGPNATGLKGAEYILKQGREVHGGSGKRTAE